MYQHGAGHWALARWLPPMLVYRTKAPVTLARGLRRGTGHLRIGFRLAFLLQVQARAPGHLGAKEETHTGKRSRAWAFVWLLAPSRGEALDSSGGAQICPKIVCNTNVGGRAIFPEMARAHGVLRSCTT